MAYCTIGDIVEYLGIGSPSDDGLIQTHIDAAHAWIDKYCHRTFESASDSTRYLDARGEHIRRSTIYFDDVGELAQITSVVNGDGVTVASNEYVTIPRNAAPYTGLRLKGMSTKRWEFTTDWEDAIAVTGRWAYSVTAPAAIKEACVALAAFYYRQKDQPFTDVTAVEMGIVVRPVGIPQHVKALLMPYRKP